MNCASYDCLLPGSVISGILSGSEAIELKVRNPALVEAFGKFGPGH